MTPQMSTPVTLRAENWSGGNRCTQRRKGHSAVTPGLRKTLLLVELEGLLGCVNILSYLQSVLMDLFSFAFCCVLINCVTFSLLSKFENSSNKCYSDFNY